MLGDGPDRDEKMAAVCVMLANGEAAYMTGELMCKPMIVRLVPLHLELHAL